MSDKGPEFSRRDVAGWLEGPKASLEDQGYDSATRGSVWACPSQARVRLRGSAGGSWHSRSTGLRVCSWPNLLSSGQPPAFLPLVIFFVEVALLTTLMGSSFGQRILGIRVISLTHGRLDPARVALRTLLLCLVVPPLVFDRDQRVHDKAAGSVAVRMGHVTTPGAPAA